MKRLILILLLCAFAANADDIIAGRPRLLLRSDMLTAMQTRAGVPSAKWTQLKNYIDPYLTTDPTASRAFLARDMALAYQVTGDTDYGDRAVRFFFASLRSLDANFAVSSISVGETAEITTTAAHGQQTGDTVHIARITQAGWTTINGSYSITVTATNKFTIVFNSTGFPAYTETRGVAVGPRVNTSTGTAWQLNAYRESVPMDAEAYDWAHDRFSATDLAAATQWLAANVVYNIAHPYGTQTNDYRWGGNMPAGQINANILLCIVLGGEWADAQTTYDTQRLIFVNNVIPEITAGVMKGGATHEGPEYGSEVGMYYFNTLDGIFLGTGESLYASAAVFMTGSTDWLLYTTSPAATGCGGGGAGGCGSYNEPMQYGDATFDPYNWNKFIDTAVVQVAQRNDYWTNAGADANRAARLAYWWQNIAPPWVSSGINNFYEFVYEPIDTASATDWRTEGLDLDYLSGDTDGNGIGLTLMRRDWTTASTWLSLHSGRVSGTDHAHAQGGEVQAYRNGKWLLASVNGWGSVWWSSGWHSAFYPNYHSGWYSPQIGSPGGDGAQQRFEQTAVYGYSRVDATGTYKFGGSGITADVNLVQRDLFYLRSADVAVVSDVVAYPSASPTLRFWRAAAEPTVAGSNITIANGTQRAGITVLAPASTVLRKVDLTTFPIVGARATNPAHLYTDTKHGKVTGNLVTISGCTGQWAALNGTDIAVTVATTPNQARSYDFNGFTIPVDASTFTDNFAAQDCITNWTRSTTGGTVLTGEYRVDASTGLSATAESGLAVIQLYTDGDAILTPTPVTPSVGNANCALIDTTLVCAANTSGSSIPLTVELGAATQVYILGIIPVEATTYKVDLTTTPGTAIITSDGAGNSVNSTAAGILTFSTTPVTLDSVTVGTATPNPLIGGTKQLVATAHWSDSTTSDVTALASWVSADSGVVSVGAATGLLTGVAAGGPVTITATYLTVPGTVDITVPALDTIAVTPTPTSAGLAPDNRQFTATCTYVDKQTDNCTAKVAWSSADEGIATVGATGLATGVSAGTVNISADWLTKSGIGALTITAPTTLYFPAKKGD